MQHPLVLSSSCHVSLFPLCLSSPLGLLPAACCVACPCATILWCHHTSLSPSCHVSWMPHLLLFFFTCCAILSLSHHAGWLLRCLSFFCHPRALLSCWPSLPHHHLTIVYHHHHQMLANAIAHHQMLPPLLSTTTTPTIECHLYHPSLQQLHSIATVKCQRPPLTNAAVKH